LVVWLIDVCAIHHSVFKALLSLHSPQPHVLFIDCSRHLKRNELRGRRLCYLKRTKRVVAGDQPQLETRRAKRELFLSLPPLLE
jgi:hypothetical protein